MAVLHGRVVRRRAAGPFDQIRRNRVANVAGRVPGSVANAASVDGGTGTTCRDLRLAKRSDGSERFKFEQVQHSPARKPDPEEAGLRLLPRGDGHDVAEGVLPLVLMNRAPGAVILRQLHHEAAQPIGKDRTVVDHDPGQHDAVQQIDRPPRVLFLLRVKPIVAPQQAVVRALGVALWVRRKRPTGNGTLPRRFAECQIVQRRRFRPLCFGGQLP